MDPEVAALLAKRYPTFHEPYRQVKEWNRSKNSHRLAQAEEFLAELIRRYPAALPIWYEWAFQASQGDDPTDAKRLRVLERLQRVRAQFGDELDIDTWSLWGRCHKDAGHEALDQALAATDAAVRDIKFERADKEYSLAIEKYDRAYRLNDAFDHFPGINVATLTFLRAGLARTTGRGDTAATLLVDARARAKQLIDQSPQWSEVHKDDNIWLRASRAEAYALLAEWGAARTLYQEALAQTNRLPMHPQSMRQQFHRLLLAYRLLDQSPSATEFDPIRQLFGTPT